MIYSETILEAAKLATEQHPEDISQAVDCAEKRIRELPEFQAHIDAFVRQSVQELVYRFRCQSNAEVRRGYAVPRPKVIVGQSKTVNGAYAEYYGFHVAGRTLGSVMGKELEAIADSEQRTGDGYHFRARLARLLCEIVPADKTVRQSVNGKKLMAIFERAEKG